MDTLSVVEAGVWVGIPVEDRESANRYIAAIVARDRHALADPGFAAWRTRQLWAQFGAEYRAAATGTYARRGGAALRIALAKL
jgi:hypothetical protein